MDPHPHRRPQRPFAAGLTIVGLVFGELVAGAVVTETVFGRNGIGQITAQAVTNRDNPILLAVVVLATLGYVVINLAVDLLYPVIDVRLRGSREPPRRGRDAEAVEAALVRAPHARSHRHRPHDKGGAGGERVQRRRRPQLG